MAKPADYVEEERTPYGIKEDVVDPQVTSDSSESSSSSEESGEPESYYSSGIYTKYPEDPIDEYKTTSGEIVTADTRKRRGTGQTADASANSADASSAKLTIPLQGLISAVEGDLVNRAKAINTDIKNIQEQKNATNCNDAIVTTTTHNPSISNDFFGQIDNSTKVNKRSDEKSARIPLEGVVKAVESTLIHSAKLVKRSADEPVPTTNSDSNEDKPNVSTPVIHVEQLSSLTGSSHLNVLGPIAAPSAPTTTTTESSTTKPTTESASTPPAAHVQHTNLTVVHSSDTLQIIPNAEDNSLHIKRQQLQKTVFHSNLAIFPTIPPETINAPLKTGPTTTESSSVDATTHIDTTDATTKNDDSHDAAKTEKLLSKIEQLQEKIAEVEADPVIVSQF